MASNELSLGEKSSRKEVIHAYLGLEGRLSPAALVVLYRSLGFPILKGPFL